jgi:4-hydroxyproline epimerase
VAAPVSFVDSHTGGEPTRVIVAGGPELGSGSLAERRRRLTLEHDAFRAGVVCEPRGSEVVVGALLVPPGEPGCAAGVIFFNNVGTLGMCGHGLIGVVATLRHLGRLGPGVHRLDTPVGTVAAELHLDGRVTLENVPSARTRRAVTLEVPGLGRVTGDVAWGGNWFFLADWGGPIDLDRVPALTAAAAGVREALRAAGVTGHHGAEVDHVELFGPPSGPHADSRSFVLCPGMAYDRSPCGTGTSAKVACLAEDGKLAEGATWRQESVVGSVFTASYRRVEGQVVPRVTGQAFVTAEGVLRFDEADPFRFGLQPPGPGR